MNKENLHPEEKSASEDLGVFWVTSETKKKPRKPSMRMDSLELEMWE
jgi:hypothetical protein